jgi:nitroreductase
LLDRWSCRAFDAQHELSDAALNSLFEAARWAPSSFNLQPWRFVLARRGEAGWSRMLATLIPFNQSWAQHASALICVCSEVDAPGKDGVRQPSYTHSFDAGAAWAYFALQASVLGLSAHAMSGFDPAAAQQAIESPPNVRVEAIVALGATGDKASLAESLRNREYPSDRRPITAFVFDHSFRMPRPCPPPSPRD